MLGNLVSDRWVVFLVEIFIGFRHFIEDDVGRRDAPRLAVGLWLMGVAVVITWPSDWPVGTCGYTHVVRLFS